MVRDDRVEDADSSNGANQQQLRTDVQDCTLLSLKGFDVVGDRNPTLCTLHPGEVAWPEPSCRFDGKHVRYGLQNMIDPDSALGTEHTRNLTMTKSPAYFALIVDAQVKAGDFVIVRLRVCSVPSAESGSIMF